MKKVGVGLFLLLLLATGYAALPQAGFAQPKAKRGMVCFTFDDGHWNLWRQYALELFAKYKGHGTFFAMGPITPEIAADMQYFHRQGHSVGLHTMRHSSAVEAMKKDKWDEYLRREVMPQLDVCRKNKIEVHSFAYPNNLCNDATDRALSEYFRYMRGGVPYLKNTKKPDMEQAFVPISRLKRGMHLPGLGLDQYYKRTQEQLDAMLERAAANDEVVIFFSHKIKPEIGKNEFPIVTSPDRLEKCLKKATELNMRIVGFDELP